MDRSYARVLEACLRLPWAIRPEVLPVVAEIVARRLAGERPGPEDVRALAGAGPASRPARTVGSIAVLPLYGVLFPKASMIGEMSGGTSLARFRASLREAVASPQISAIVIDVDSPGGLVDLVPETAQEIRQARAAKPVVAVANTEAASAAYWLASQASELVVTPSGMVGSIGVYAAHEDISKALEMRGVRTTLISAGRYKTEGNPFEPLAEEGRAHIQSVVDDYYRAFTQDVARGRGVAVDRVRQGYGEGRMLTAQRALAEGMVDRVETLEATLRRLGSRSGGTAAVLRVALSDADGIVTVTTSGPASSLQQLSAFAGPWAAEPAAGPLPVHDTEVVDRPWDADREVSEIPDDAGQAVLRRMYVWQDPEGDPDTKAAFKLPHHEVEDGEPRAANVNGVRAALSRLGQEDTEIPESDRPGCERHLRAHLDRFNEERGRAARERARERVLRLYRGRA